MDFKLIAKFNKLRSQLSEQELMLADVFYNAGEDDKQLIVESLHPVVATKAAQKQPRCTHVYSSGLVCNAASRNYVHHNSAHLDFHQFTTVKAKKSARAQSLGEQIQKRTKRTDSDDDNRFDDEAAQVARAELLNEGGLCVVGIDSSGMTCGEFADHNIHHLNTHPDYHEFVAAETAAAATGGD